MQYVMVPVPEEQLDDVLTFILQKNLKREVVPWAAGTLGQFYEEIDEQGRSLLSYVAGAMATGRGLPDKQAGALMELRVGEVFGLMRELNERAEAANHPKLIGYRAVAQLLPDGRTEERRLFTMKDAVAGYVHQAEQADRLAHPSSFSHNET